MSGSQAVGVAVLLLFAALLAVGFALYFTGRGHVLSALWAGSRAFLSEWGGRLRADLIARNARHAEARAARQRESRLGVEVGLTPSAVVDRAVEFMTKRDYGIESRSDGAVTFARHQGADTAIGCFLMLFFLVPGLLYLLLAQKTARVTMAAYPHESGSRVVLGGDDREAVEQLTVWARDLSSEPTAAPEQRLDPRPTGESIGDRLRRLDELKDMGLVSQEEYQAKRAEILGEV